MNESFPLAMSPDPFAEVRQQYGRRFIEPLATFPYVEGVDDFLTQYRNACSEIEGSHSAATVRNITAVGALVEAVYLNSLSNRDTAFLRDGLSTLGDLGIPVSPQFNLTTMNLAHDLRGDFLHHPVPTDLLLICFICNRSVSEKYMQANEVWMDRGTLTSSDRHEEVQAWQKAAQQSGAKFIITFGGNWEVNPRHFRGGDYHLVGRMEGSEEPYSLMCRTDMIPYLPSRQISFVPK